MTALLDRIAELERQVTSIRYELIELRAQAERAEASEAEPPPLRTLTPPPAPPQPPQAATPRPLPFPPRQQPVPRGDVGAEQRSAAARTDRDVSLADLLGAKALAWAGGIVTLLGVVFFFVLAVNRGWVGPELRVAFGGIASIAVLGAGLWLRTRFGETHSSLAAVGAGIAGGYATLLAATALYSLVPTVAALAGAAAIAAAAVAISLLWSAELVAALGLVGAMVVPALLAIDGGVSRTGTAFVAIVLAAVAVVGVRWRWTALLSTAGVVSAVQAAALVEKTAGHPWSAVVLAAAFWALYLGIGIADHLARRGPLASLPTAFVLGSAAFALYAGILLFGSTGQGIAMLAAAGLAAATAVVLVRVPRGRELAVLLGAVALAQVAIGLSDLLSGGSLTYAWAAEGALLGWVALRLRQTRFQIAAFVYLALAGGRALLFEASFDHLFRATSRPAGGAPLVAATAAGLALAAFLMRPWDEPSDAEAGVLRPLRQLVEALRAHRDDVRAGGFVLAALGFVYAGSLGLLALFQQSPNGVLRSFQDGHVAVTGVWAALGIAAFVVAVRRGRSGARALAGGWLAFVTLEAVAFDAVRLPHDLAAQSLLFVAGALLAATLLLYLLDDGLDALDPFAALASLVSLVFALRGATWIAEDVLLVREGLAVVAVGVVYGALGTAMVSVSRVRDAGTVLWAPGFAVVTVGEAMAFSGTTVAVLWTLGAIVLAALGYVFSEPRLRIGALALAALTAGYALIEQAPPSQLVHAGDRPAAGAVSLVLAVLAIAAAGLLARIRERGDVVDRLLAASSRRVRSSALWAAGVLAVYTLSLGILHLAESTGSEVRSSFQRGHVGVSAFWGLIGLGLLYVGLRRDGRSLRLGGFALFGLILAKIFLYDLAALSSITRALSFLAVGAVLLLGGFFYQRLSTQLDDRPGIARML